MTLFIQSHWPICFSSIGIENRY